jgi:hypothetical protein
VKLLNDNYMDYMFAQAKYMQMRFLCLVSLTELERIFNSLGDKMFIRMQNISIEHTRIDNRSNMMEFTYKFYICSQSDVLKVEGEFDYEMEHKTIKNEDSRGIEPSCKLSMGVEEAKFDSDRHSPFETTKKISKSETCRTIGNCWMGH